MFLVEFQPFRNAQFRELTDFTYFKTMNGSGLWQKIGNNTAINIEFGFQSNYTGYTTVVHLVPILKKGGKN